MPAPRAARLASRKSVIPDPSLYANHSDDSSEGPQSPPPPARSTIKTTTSNTSKGKQRAHSPPLPTLNLSNPRSKPSRSSTESAQEVQTSNKLSNSTSRRLNDVHPADDRDDRHKSKPSTTKRKRVERASEDEDSEQRQHDDRAKASKSKSSSQRSKAGQESIEHQEEEEEEAESAKQRHQTTSQRKGNFIPRAAASQTTRPNKPPPQFAAQLGGGSDDDDDTEPFMFTTHPPTPHAQSASVKRPATKAKQNPKGKTPRIHAPPPLQREDGDREDQTPVDDDARRAPLASTSRVKLTPPRNDSSHVAITTHETPVQIRNVAFRQGPGTPATVSRTARRNSSGSARRGSSIGGGFSATPHPEISDSELWRSLDPHLPDAARTRTILSWATQRQRSTLFEGKQGRTGAKSDRRDGTTTVLGTSERIAKEAIDEFIDGICNLSIDTSVPYREVQRSDPSQLPPNPQNIENAEKKEELQEEFGVIAKEQNSRQTISAIYTEFATRRNALRQAPSTSLLARSVEPVSLVESFDLSLRGPTSFEEAEELGRKLLEDAAKPDSSSRPSGVNTVKEANGEDVLDLEIRETLELTPHLRQMIHRVGGFTHVASEFITSRSAESHRALTSHSLQGLESTTSSSSTTTNTPSAPTSQGGSSSQLAGLVGIVGPSQSIGGGLDPRDLLRGISRRDTSARR